MDTSTDMQPGAQELPANPPDDQRDEQGQTSGSLKGQAGAPVEAAKFPSVKSPLPPTGGRFGVVSSTGQLVCEFKEDDDEPKSQTTEEKIFRTAPPSSEPITPGGSISPPPPPQGGDQNELAPPNSTLEDRTGSTSGLELSVDHDSYPEVYLPDGPELSQPLQGSLNSLHLGSSAPTSSTSGEFIKTGYLENHHMSMSNPIDVPLVTPLHLLGDQSDTVDCPFCMKRVETMVVKKASERTHVWGTICLLTTFFGMPIPYYRDWYKNVEHHCQNCKRKIAYRKYNATEYEPLGTLPEHRAISRFEAAEHLEKKRWLS